MTAIGIMLIAVVFLYRVKRTLHEFTSDLSRLLTIVQFSHGLIIGVLAG